MDTKRWPNKNVTIRVRNIVCGRVDVHKNLNKDDLSWFTCNPNLEVEILDRHETFRSSSRDGD